MNYEQVGENMWINKVTNKLFSTQKFRGEHGKEFNFLARPGSFISSPYGLRQYLNFFDRTGIDRPKMTITDEIVFSNHDNGLDGKRVLVLGGGPSASQIDWESKYDIVITSNNYYKKFKKDPYLISFTPYIPIMDEQIHSFLKSNNSLIGIEPEFLKIHEQKSISKFCKLFEGRIVFHHTRYSSTLGVGARQSVLAVLLGASEVHMCGLDLFKSEDTSSHSFEGKKGAPRWRQMGEEFQNRQIIAFWSYLSKIAKERNCIIKNISEDLECNCMAFISKEYEEKK